MSTDIWAVNLAIQQEYRTPVLGPCRNSTNAPHSHRLEGQIGFYQLGLAFARHRLHRQNVFELRVAL